VELDIVLMSQNRGLRNWWAPPKSGIWGPSLRFRYSFICQGTL